MTEGIGLQMFPENRCGRPYKVIWETVHTNRNPILTVLRYQCSLGAPP